MPCMPPARRMTFHMPLSIARAWPDTRLRASSGPPTVAASRSRKARSAPSVAIRFFSIRSWRNSPGASTRSLYTNAAGWKSVTEAGDHVIATVHDRANDRRFQIAARYVIDCSGGRSVIRPALGIDMHGSDYLGYFLSIFVRAPELWTHHTMGKAALINFVDARGMWSNLISLDGRELYRFAVIGKAYYDDPQGVDAEELLRSAFGKDLPHEILSVRRWSARNVVADAYRHGRIFFAGDAAHLNHPAAGLGLNTGLGDIVDLGWKLSAMLAGWGGDYLLDSYEPERRPVGLRNIGHADVSHSTDRKQRTHPEIAMDTPAGAEARRKMGDELRQTQISKIITDGLALGYQYAGSPIVFGDGTVPLASSVSEYRPTTFPGSRAPHAWLSEGRSTLDVFGNGFTLLRLGADAPQPSLAGARLRAAPCAARHREHRRSCHLRSL